MTTVLLEDLKRLAPQGRHAILKGIAEHAHLLAEFGIVTPLRLSHFLAQTAQESDGFRAVREYADGSDYEGRTDLGNVRKGDGRRFRGRTLMMVTGRANTRAFTLWCRRRDPSCPDFEAQPQNMEQFPWALLGALWYWQRHDLNALADRNDLRRITRKINGGYNGLRDRQHYFARAWRIWGEGDIRYAGRGKAALASTTNGAAAALGLGSLSVISDYTGVASDMAYTVRDLLPDGAGEEAGQAAASGNWWLFAGMALTIALLAGWIIRERMRKAREFEV